MRRDTERTSATRRQRISRVKARENIHQFEEDSHERRVHCEDEIRDGNVCILENITKNKYDEDLNTTRDAVTTLYTLIPENNTDHHGTDPDEVNKRRGAELRDAELNSSNRFRRSRKWYVSELNRTHRTVRII